jgi:GntR family transcriptional regulator
LYDILRGRIQRGEWKIGEMIPPGPVLMEQYGVSRITVRQVLDRLVKEGLIYRQRGRGSFVAAPTLEQGLFRILSFTEDMRQRGLDPGTELIAQEVIPAPEEIAAWLKVRLASRWPPGTASPGERGADERENARLVHRYCPQCWTAMITPRSRCVIARENCIRLVNANQIIRAVTATPSPVELRGSENLLLVHRARFLFPGLFPIEYLKIYYRADRYSLYNELHE